MIEIYGKPQCPFCDKAKNLCETRGYKYTYKSLGTDYTREELGTVSKCKNSPSNCGKW
jgi:glutaredoxin